MAMVCHTTTPTAEILLSEQNCYRTLYAENLALVSSIKKL